MSLHSTKRHQWRLFKDNLARYAVGLGGSSVIFAILLIFFYLLYVVIPLLKPADMEVVAEYAVPGGASETLYLAMEEQAEIAVRFEQSGAVTFFHTGDGTSLGTTQLPLPADVQITSFAAAEPGTGVVAMGLSNGQALVVRHRYRVSFPDDRRKISPELEYPLGEKPVMVDPQGQPLTRLTIQSGESTTLVAYTRDGRLPLLQIRQEESFLSDEVTLERTESELPLGLEQVRYLLLDAAQETLYASDGKDRVSHYDLRDKEAPVLAEQLVVVSSGAHITSLSYLAGGLSLLVGDSRGHLSQWFRVRDESDHYNLHNIRSFDGRDSPVREIIHEYNRKGFLVGDADGWLGIYHATANRTVLLQDISENPLVKLAVGPRADALLALDALGQMRFARIHNEHPEISFSSLWGKVWYESYPEPAYIWQSSSASNDFEPKFSITPLAFGTLKAAFYAMLFAMPLAILGAIYTAYFMAPRMRQIVKPTIEIMEALPTVILGFLAGLWLAPYMEDHLPGIFTLLIVLPLGVVLFAYAWHRLPAAIRNRVPDGWEAGLLVLPIIFLTWLSMVLSAPMEVWLFGGDMRLWMSHELGIGFDQRNSLVVGLAMGFAVIPTIFSIAEDAIFSVPKQLTFGSLALGATTWQTLVRVVLLTASPGIFSGVMIGLGRAVGETMIVLMATGNTPVMDFSIFQGMRTLSANIAVEMPESEVASTHYRVLFLAALVLFLFTFVFNTLAEIIRQRLRKKYSSL